MEVWFNGRINVRSLEIRQAVHTDSNFIVAPKEIY